MKFFGIPKQFQTSVPLKWGNQNFQTSNPIKLGSQKNPAKWGLILINVFLVCFHIA